MQSIANVHVCRESEDVGDWGVEVDELGHACEAGVEGLVSEGERTGSSSDVLISACLHLASSTSGLGPVSEVAGFESWVRENVDASGVDKDHFLFYRNEIKVSSSSVGAEHQIDKDVVNCLGLVNSEIHAVEPTSGKRERSEDSVVCGAISEIYVHI
eukprot:Phypoly_transcript_09293.p1 GENE.Phypoly_transcript_09293~~Phypoly_transcript_09293.p1  ORF type:complete len:157 (-),score=7.92 Phypoly_transcript_09293:698-1168(-)